MKSAKTSAQHRCIPLRRVWLMSATSNGHESKPYEALEVLELTKTYGFLRSFVALNFFKNKRNPGERRDI